MCFSGFLSHFSVAQISISCDKESLAALKSLTVVFFLPKEDFGRLAEFENALKDVWTITPFIVARIDEKDRYSDGHQYATFGFDAIEEVISRTTRSSVTPSPYGVSQTNYLTRMCMTLYLPQLKKNGKQKDPVALSYVLLMPDATTFKKAKNYNNQNSIVPSFLSAKKLLAMMYETSKFGNWGPGYLRNYAHFINDAISGKKDRDFYKKIFDNLGLHNLKTTTLYVPEYPKMEYNLLLGPTQVKDDLDSLGDLANAYPYKIEYISNEALQEKILQGGESFYYLSLYRSPPLINLLQLQKAQRVK